MTLGFEREGLDAIVLDQDEERILDLLRSELRVPNYLLER